MRTQERHHIARPCRKYAIGWGLRAQNVTKASPFSWICCVQYRVILDSSIRIICNAMVMPYTELSGSHIHMQRIYTTRCGSPDQHRPAVFITMVADGMAPRRRGASSYHHSSLTTVSHESNITAGLSHWNFGQICTHERHPIPRPYGRAMGCLSRVIQRKLTALYRVRTVLIFLLAGP